MSKKQFNFLLLHSDWWGTDNNIKELPSNPWVSRICQHNGPVFIATFYSAWRNKTSNWCHLSWFHMRQRKKSDWYILPTSSFSMKKCVLMGKQSAFLSKTWKMAGLKLLSKYGKYKNFLSIQLLSNFGLPAASAVQFKIHYSNNAYKDQYFTPTGISVA